MTDTHSLPDRTEAAEYYFTYIDQVPRDADIRRVLETQLAETFAVLAGYLRRASRCTATRPTSGAFARWWVT